MAKTESTAVNELIDLVQNGKQQAVPEPAADLFAAPKSTRVSPPRMTSPLPPMRGAGEVEPLPRGRAPHSTSQHSTKLPTPVRMSTADPERGNTIPPLARATTRPPAPPTRATSSNPTVRASASALPPPPRTMPRATSPIPGQRPSAPPPPQRASSPRSIQSRATVPSLPSLPPLTAPVAAPFEARSDNKPFGVPQQFPIIGRPQTVDVTGDIVKADSWFDVSAAVHKIDADGTAVVPRPLNRDTLSLVKKLAVPTIVLAIIGIMVGGYFAFDGNGGKKKKTVAASVAEAPKAETHVAMAVAPTEAPPAAPAQAEPPTKAEQVEKQAAAETEAAKPAADSGSMLPAATTAVLTHEPAKAAPTKTDVAPKAEPAPAPTKAEPALAAVAAPATAPKAEPAPTEAAPVKAVAPSTAPAAVREVQTVRGVVKLVDVRIDSKPSGATVMLVDNGKTSFLGSTPLATSLDPSRKYDVIFTSPGRPTQMAPLDPAKTSRLDVTLARAKSGHRAKKEASASLGDSFIDKSVDKPAAEPKADKKPPGEGTLMVSSKPPCEIVIDGKPTGLTTPQRSIPLSVGAHKITFINDAEGIKKTVSVSITADQSTKLIQDLMKK
jgi:hypothetical protein